jgi:hypothetical protein
VVVWHGVYVPKGTPRPVVDRLTQALQTALKDPEVVRRMQELGAEVVPVDKRDAWRAPGLARGRDRQVGARDPQGRRVRGLIMRRIGGQPGRQGGC